MCSSAWLKASICGTDVQIYNWNAWAQKAIPAPMTIGHEFVGVVDRVGERLSNSPRCFYTQGRSKSRL
jgi:threonine dehydrogenase-like Zn-dependent dehydrogenase